MRKLSSGTYLDVSSYPRGMFRRTWHKRLPCKDLSNPKPGHPTGVNGIGLVTRRLSLVDFHNNEYKHLECFWGSINVSNQQRTRSRHHGPRFAEGLSADCQWFVSNDLGALFLVWFAWETAALIKPLRTMVIQGLSGKYINMIIVWRITNKRNRIIPRTLKV